MKTLRSGPAPPAIRRKFVPQFWEPLCDGSKISTIRQAPKRRPSRGWRFIAEGWEGRPYRSNVVTIGEGFVTACEDIVINPGFAVLIAGRPLTQAQLAHLADIEGFASLDAMREWFDRYTLPFTGVQILFELDLCA